MTDSTPPPPSNIVRVTVLAVALERAGWWRNEAIAEAQRRVDAENGLREFTAAKAAEGKGDGT